VLKEKEAVIRNAMILLDAFVVSVAFFMAFFIRQHFRVFYTWDLFPSMFVVQDTAVSLSEYLAVFFFLVPLWCILLYLNGMYRALRTKKHLEIVWILIKSAFLVTIIFGAVVFMFKLGFVSRLFFVIFMVVCMFFILAEKIVIFSVMHYLQKRGYNFRTVLIVGTGKRASHFIKRIHDHPEWGFRILGAIDDEPGRGVESVNSVKVIGTLADIPEILHTQATDEVVFVVPRSRLSYMENAIYACETEGVKASIAVDLFDVQIAKAYLTEIDDIPLVTFQTTIAKEWQLFIKRAIDIIISGLSIVLLSPFLLIAAILIKMTSSGPVLFKQLRLGLNGRKFLLYKFRTMYKDAEKELINVNDVSEKDRPEFRKKKIQWMTPIGRVLRKLSLDEFPQLFNVFIGQMSLVGPRPTVPDEVSLYRTWQRRRFSMKPGITCLWQVKGRNKIGFEDWMKLDLEYLDNWSLWLDFKILAKTIPVVLFGIGAY